MLFHELQTVVEWEVERSGFKVKGFAVGYLAVCSAARISRLHVLEQIVVRSGQLKRNLKKRCKGQDVRPVNLPVSNISKDGLPHLTFKIFQVPFWTSMQHGWLQCLYWPRVLLRPSGFCPRCSHQSARSSLFGRCVTLGTVEALTLRITHSMLPIQGDVYSNFTGKKIKDTLRNAILHPSFFLRQSECSPLTFQLKCCVTGRHPTSRDRAAACEAALLSGAVGALCEADEEGADAGG